MSSYDAQTIVLCQDASLECRYSRHVEFKSNIPPTNNAAERGLREIVVHRKIRGGIRAKETMTWLANFFSCVMTWKNNKLDYLAEIAKYA